MGVTTTLAAASGAVAAMLCSLLTTRPLCKAYDVVAPLNGILAGLVSITAGCNVVSPEGSIGIGLVGGVVYAVSSALLRKMRIDDPIDAFSVHGACGIWGVIAVGPFGIQEFICGDAASNCITMPGQTLMQIVGVLVIIAWTGITSTILFGLLNVYTLLRASQETELHGLDLDHHMGYTGVLRQKQEKESTTGELDVVLKVPSAE